MTRFTKITTLTAVVVAIGGGSTAMAQTSPADDVYSPNNEVADVVASGTPTPTPTPGTGTAPETTSDSPSSSNETAPETTTSPATPTATPSTQTTQEASTGSLPFTGFEAGFVGLAGLALIAGGFAVRRASRTDS